MKIGGLKWDCPKAKELRLTRSHMISKRPGKSVL
jgi:hypothetical protein